MLTMLFMTVMMLAMRCWKMILTVYDEETTKK